MITRAKHILILVAAGPLVLVSAFAGAENHYYAAVKNVSKNYTLVYKSESGQNGNCADKQGNPSTCADISYSSGLQWLSFGWNAVTSGYVDVNYKIFQGKKYVGGVTLQYDFDHFSWPFIKNIWDKTSVNITTNHAWTKCPSQKWNTCGVTEIKIDPWS